MQIASELLLDFALSGTELDGHRPTDENLSVLAVVTHKSAGATGFDEIFVSVRLHVLLLDGANT